MKLILSIAASLLVALVVSAQAQAATRPITCGPKWVHVIATRNVKFKARSWDTAGDVKRNLSCRIVMRDASRIVRHGTYPWRSGPWMFDDWKPNGVQYYGGHGLWLRIYYLVDTGYRD